MHLNTKGIKQQKLDELSKLFLRRLLENILHSVIHILLAKFAIFQWWVWMHFVVIV